ncbi:MAG TPA: cytochrome b/b6 domain-containing protein [Gammaproteobacteria bacterium]|nr:cytochrome b/b6 domain-containing protein [Gammaproteobacteria bacterium]
MVRIGHWLIVVGFFVAYFTEDDLLTAHVWAGYLVGTVVLVRIVWGFTGPEHARFSNFAYGPGKAVRYLLSLLRGHADRYLGHSPAGAAMVILLLFSLAATVGSGLTVYAYDRGAGPLAPLLVSAPAVGERVNAVTAAIPEARFVPDRAQEKRWEEIHELFANFTLLLVVLHVGGVLLASYVHRENLVRAMVTGFKRGPKQGA